MKLITLDDKTHDYLMREIEKRLEQKRRVARGCYRSITLTKEISFLETLKLTLSGGAQ